MFCNNDDFLSHVWNKQTMQQLPLSCPQTRVHTLDTVCPLTVPPEDPVVDGSPELLLMAGTPYNLTCVTRGAKPAAHIQWTKDGVAIEGAYHSTVGLPLHFQLPVTTAAANLLADVLSALRMARGRCCLHCLGCTAPAGSALGKYDVQGRLQHKAEEGNPMRAAETWGFIALFFHSFQCTDPWICFLTSLLSSQFLFSTQIYYTIKAAGRFVRFYLCSGNTEEVIIVNYIHHVHLQSCR